MTSSNPVYPSLDLAIVEWKNILMWRKLWTFYKNIFIGQNFERTPSSISDMLLPISFPRKSSRRKAYIPLFLLLRGLGNPSRWITCHAFDPPSKEMIVYLWWLISFQRWPFSHPARRASQRQILPRSSSNKCGSILGYYIPSSLTGTTGSSTHFGVVSGLY